MNELMIRLFNNEVFLGAFWGAVLGAFFAFLLERFGAFITRIQKRKKRHYNTLVTLFKELNMNGETIHNNIFVIKNVVKILEKKGLSFHSIITIPINTKHYDNLLNIEFINNLYEYQAYLRKVNSDIKGINDMYSKVSVLLMQNKDRKSYEENLANIILNLKTIKIFLEQLDEKLIVLMAKTKIMLREDVPFFVRIQKIFTQNNTIEKLVNANLEKEIVEIKEQIEESKMSSKVILGKIEKELRNK